MSVFAAVRIGVDILSGEGVRLDSLFAHGGLFKTPRVAQQILADALETPVSVGDTAGEGGAVGDLRPQNMPGTGADLYPNWCVPLCDSDGEEVAIEDLPTNERLTSLFALLRGSVR